MEEPDRRRVAGYEVSVPNEFLEAIKAGKTVVALRKTIRSGKIGRIDATRIDLRGLRALDRQLEEHPFYLGAE